MLSEVIETEHKKISNRANFDKAGVSYISVLIENDFQLYSEVFSEQSPRKVYERTLSLIGDLDKEFTSIIGINIYHFLPNQIPEIPEIILGWTGFSGQSGIEKTPDNDEIPHYKILTPRGLQILDEYRSMRGYVTTGEQRKIRSKEIFG